MVVEDSFLDEQKDNQIGPKLSVDMTKLRLPYFGHIIRRQNVCVGGENRKG